MKLPAGYGPTYPSVWIKPREDGGWQVSFCFGPDREVCHSSTYLKVVEDLAAVWREDAEAGRGPSCVECLGQGDLPCLECGGSGEGVKAVTREGDQISGSCPLTRVCDLCRGQGTLDVLSYLAAAV